MTGGRGRAHRRRRRGRAPWAPASSTCCRPTSSSARWGTSARRCRGCRSTSGPARCRTSAAGCCATGSPSPGEYVAGWIKRGPSGVVGTNKHDARRDRGRAAGRRRRRRARHARARSATWCEELRRPRRRAGADRRLAGDRRRRDRARCRRGAGRARRCTSGRRCWPPSAPRPAAERQPSAASRSPRRHRSVRGRDEAGRAAPRCRGVEHQRRAVRGQRGSPGGQQHRQPAGDVVHVAAAAVDVVPRRRRAVGDQAQVDRRAAGDPHPPGRRRHRDAVAAAARSGRRPWSPAVEPPGRRPAGRPPRRLPPTAGPRRGRRPAPRPAGRPTTSASGERPRRQARRRSCPCRRAGRGRSTAGRRPRRRRGRSSLSTGTPERVEHLRPPRRARPRRRRVAPARATAISTLRGGAGGAGTGSARPAGRRPGGRRPATERPVVAWQIWSQPQATAVATTAGCSSGTPARCRTTASAVPSPAHCRRSSTADARAVGQQPQCRDPPAPARARPPGRLSRSAAARSSSVVTAVRSSGSATVAQRRSRSR